MRSAVVLNYVLISSTTLVLSRIGRWSNRHRRHLFETFLSNSLFYFFPFLFFVFVFYRRSASSTLMRQVFTPRRILLRIISFRRIKSHRGVCLTPGELKKKKKGGILSMRAIQVVKSTRFTSTRYRRTFFSF